MNFLLPAFLAGGSLIGLPLLLHFLRKKPTRTIPFPSLRFLGPTVLRQSRRHRIRRWIVLALRCLAILLLALAFARPFFAPPPDETGTAMVVAVDNSFSMQTGERWETLRQWALERTAALGADDRLGILLMHPTPTWLVPVSEDVESARAALRELVPGYHATRYQPALRLAGETLAALPNRRRTLVWMADEQRLGWNAADFRTPLPDGVELVAAAPQPAPARQAWVSDLRVTALQDRLVAEAKVAATTDGARTATLRVDGRAVETRQLTLRAGQSASVRFSPMPGAAEPHGIEIALDPDDLAADDTAYASWQPNEGLPVVLPATEVREGEADFLAHAIAAGRSEEGAALRTVPWSAGSTWQPGEVLALRGEAIFQEPGLTEYLRSGGRACWFYEGGPAQKEWLGRLGVVPEQRGAGQHLGSVDLEHPVMSPFQGRSLVTLLNLHFDRAWGFDEDTVIPIARWADGSVALGEVRIGEGTLLLAGFDLSRTGGNLVIETAFVPLVHSALSWLHRSSRSPDVLQVGDTVEIAGGPAELILPDGTTRPVEGAWLADRPGLYRLVQKNGTRTLAANVDPAESDLTPWPASENLAQLQSDRPASRRGQRAALAVSGEKAERQRQVWWWLLGIAAVCLLTEMTLANRTAV